MSTEDQAQSQEAGGLSKEALFPGGMPGTREWKEDVARQREAAKTAELEPETAEGEAETEEDLAEAQVDQSEAEGAEQAQEVALGRMRLKEFLDAAGVSMEEFYRDVVVERDGAEVSVSQAWDDYKSLKQANDALLRERSELAEKVEKAAVQVPQQGISPEAQALATQAQMRMQQITTTDWSQVDPGQAANIKFDLRQQAEDLWQQAQGKQAEHERNMRSELKKALDEADRQTRAAIPEWNDQAVRTTEWKGIGDMLSGYGIAQQEIDGVVDPRWRRFLRDALKASGERARIEAGVRKINKVGGKTLSPGARATQPTTSTLAGARAQLKRARSEGARGDQLAAERLRVQLPDMKPGKKRR